MNSYNSAMPGTLKGIPGSFMMSRRLMVESISDGLGHIGSRLCLPALLLLCWPCGAPAQQFNADTLIPPSTYAVQGARR